ncbi:MAG: hypothetical protein M0P33_02765 [Massilibacteroides sp.]|nr:hypothetical protein [Massilibacteroides sp.]
MKQTKNKRGLLLVLLIMGFVTFSAKAVSVTKEKIINKVFTVGNEDRLSLDNCYGSITLKHWDKNEVSIKVVIRSKSRSEKGAIEGLERVDIDLLQKGNEVKAITNITNSPSGFSSFFSKVIGSELSIDYEVTMPPLLFAKLQQKYGDIMLPASSEEEMDIDIQYGTLTAGNLNNYVKIKASYSKVAIENLGKADLDLAYVKNFTMSNADSLKVDAKYSSMYVKKIKRIALKLDYGSIDFNELYSGNIETRYSNLDIVQLTGTLKLEADYSNLDIAKITKDFKDIQIDLKYSDLGLVFHKDAAFILESDHYKLKEDKLKKIYVSDVVRVDDYLRSARINGGGTSHVQLKEIEHSKISFDTVL